MNCLKEFLIVIIAISTAKLVDAQKFYGPDTVTVHSGELILKALLWRPAGRGPFPTVIFSHGNYASTDTILDPLKQIPLLGPLFAGQGYIYLGLFRRGVGLSKGQGENCDELMTKAFKDNGQEGRNKMQLRQLETDQLQDMISGLNFLRQRRDVDTNRMALIGHSFGGSLALLVAQQESGLKAVVIFGGAGYSWDHSLQLRTRLISAVKNINSPIMIIHAQNDYSTDPGYALDSILNLYKKPHTLKIYPAFGNTKSEGHNLIFLNIETWKADVFRFLDENLQR